MSFTYTDISTNSNDFELKESEVINSCLLKNNQNDIKKAIEFLQSEDNFLYIHGFLGTGKRQFVNYVCEYLSKDVLKLEYFCKESTVCDDILLSFTNELESSTGIKTYNLNAKITTLTVKFQQLINSTKRPMLIILHTLDNIKDDTLQLIIDIFSKILNEQNVKIIITTCALKTSLLGDLGNSQTIFLKAFTKDIFKEFLLNNEIKASDRQVEDLYALTRGYYFYTALSVKLLQTLNISVSDFMQKIKNADSNFDNYIGELYISLVPVAIRNFFWFLKAVRHGLSLNALAVLEIYDEFSIQYLISNMIIFQRNEILYLHDYFAKNISIILPKNTEIRLHKYIIGIYEQQLKENLQNRVIFISRQALRSEIEYHSKKIYEIENGISPDLNDEPTEQAEQNKANIATVNSSINNTSLLNLMEEAKKLESEDKITEAIEKFKTILDTYQTDSNTLIDIRLNLAKLYSKSGNNNYAMHYYELAEAYYKSHNETINLNYLYYELSDLFYRMYKTERAIETLKKVIYSVDTPQSLMVSACTRLGNIYSDIDNPNEAFSYYQKAIDSLDENVGNEILSELYFKFALANDDKGDINLAFEYYNRCISITSENNYIALAYSNLAQCYYESGNTDDALDCYTKAYKIEHTNNNYEGIYYTTSNIAKILNERNDRNVLKFLLEAKQSAEFIDDTFNIIESSVALGDYYYNIPEKSKEALTEYCKARQTALNTAEDIDITNINKRIHDMKLRMPENIFTEISQKYE